VYNTLNTSILFEFSADTNLRSQTLRDGIVFFFFLGKFRDGIVEYAKTIPRTGALIGCQNFLFVISFPLPFFFNLACIL
jgi:hypothetical protein